MLSCPLVQCPSKTNAPDSGIVLWICSLSQCAYLSSFVQQNYLGCVVRAGLAYRIVLLCFTVPWHIKVLILLFCLAVSQLFWRLDHFARSGVLHCLPPRNEPVFCLGVLYSLIGIGGMYGVGNGLVYWGATSFKNWFDLQFYCLASSLFLFMSRFVYRALITYIVFVFVIIIAVFFQ